MNFFLLRYSPITPELHSTLCGRRIEKCIVFEERKFMKTGTVENGNFWLDDLAAAAVRKTGFQVDVFVHVLAFHIKELQNKYVMN